MTRDDKFNRLKENLNQLERVIIAYSGGVDSTFLLKAASLSGLKEILAVTASSESLPREELSFARKMTTDLHIKNMIIETKELEDEHYAKNPVNRCYYCKRELFTKLKDIASKENFSFILDGTNADDLHDWRPGRHAAQELGIHSPLLDVGLTKREIRDISRLLGLPTWNKPATPCLSSRFPYGQKITAESLERVGRAETFIKKLGLTELRVRDHSGIARIEVIPEEFSLLMNKTTRGKITAFLESLGYRHVTLDLGGFRSGNLNREELKNE
jgi:uncharacterized protein